MDYQAAILSIPTPTLSKALRDDPAVKTAMYQGRAESSLRIRQTAYEMAISGNNTAMTIFWLKTREGFREKAPETPASQERAINLNYLPKSQREEYRAEITAFENELFGSTSEMTLEAEISYGSCEKRHRKPGQP
jgi:hypothetical protein